MEGTGRKDVASVSFEKHSDRGGDRACSTVPVGISSTLPSNMSLYPCACIGWR